MAHLTKWNDRYQHKRWSQDDKVKMYRFEKELEKSIEDLFSNKLKRIDLEPFMQSNEPWKLTVIRQICNKHGVKYIDITNKIESEKVESKTESKVEPKKLKAPDALYSITSISMKKKSNTLDVSFNTKKTYITLVMGKLSTHRLG